ncbi:MAG: hypothetical protein Kow0068_04250 [Marinilabiliales bacterium]
MKLNLIKLKTGKEILGLCPICKRELIKGPSINEHHLIPKSLKGKEKIIIHKICHQKIHSLFTERELLNHYNTVDKIIAHKEMKKFIKWVNKHEPEYYRRSKPIKEKQKNQ